MKLQGMLEEDAEIYVQSFYKDGSGDGWNIANLKKGTVKYGYSSETYAPKGRVIYIPKGNRQIHSFSKKEKLTIKIQTDYDWF